MNSCVDHRLDCEDMPCLHEASGFVTCIVRNVGGTMEQFPSSMSTVSPIDTETVFLNELSDHIANISVHSSRLANGDCLFQTFIRFGHEEFTAFGNFPDQISLIEINVEPILVDSDIEVDNITIFQWSAVGDTVANDFINRSGFK
jgi:hypothetical protein